MNEPWYFLAGFLLGGAAAWGWCMCADRAVKPSSFYGRKQEEMDSLRRKCRARRGMPFADTYEAGVLATLNWLSYPNHQPPLGDDSD